MLKRDLNKLMTEKLNKYLAYDWELNIETMGGHQSDEVSKVDLTNGEEVIRIFIGEIRSDFDRGYEVVVGYMPSKIRPHQKDHGCIWNNELLVIDREEFWEVSRNSDYLVSKEEMLLANKKRTERGQAKYTTSLKTEKQLIDNKAFLKAFMPYLHLANGWKSVRPSEIYSFYKLEDSYHVAYKRGGSTKHLTLGHEELLTARTGFEGFRYPY